MRFWEKDGYIEVPRLDFLVSTVVRCVDLGGNILDFAFLEMIHIDVYAICHVPSVSHDDDRSLLD